MKNKKFLALLLSAVLLIGVVAGGTLAWLTDTTAEVKNTFTVGNIEIDLTETDADEDQNRLANDYKMIPGWTITKDPVATVKANSEDCYLFVKLVESDNFGDFMEYKMGEGWDPLPDVDGVYYREVELDDEDQSFPVIKNNTVTVLDDVTKDDMDALTTAGRNGFPSLDVTAYAVQKYKTNNTPFGAVDAWKVLFPPANP